MFVSRNLRRASLALLAPLVAACSEKLEEGAACGTLCPNQQIVVQDTVVTPVDTALTVVGLPGTGQEIRLLAAVRGTDLDVRSVIRFDSLPQRYQPKTTDTTTAAITSADSTRLRLALDLLASRITGPATIELFDVDSVTNDTTPTNVLPLFRTGGATNRRIGSRTFSVAELLDTVSIPVSDSALVSKVTATGRRRLRVGIRVTAATKTLLYFTSTEGATSIALPPALTFRPSLDTASRTLAVSPRDVDTVSASATTFSRADYVVAAAGAIPPSTASTVVEAGGLPGRRGYLRFVLPAHFADTTLTVVRAALEITQVGIPGSLDTVSVFPLVSFAGRAVTDPSRAAGLTDAGLLGSSGVFRIDSLVLPSSQSAVRTVDLLSVVRYWVSPRERSNPHAIVLAVRYEGATPGVARFATGSALVAPADRPRLVISYVNRVPFNLP